MGRDLAMWLAGYHYFKQQYVARNDKYIPLGEIFYDLEQKYNDLPERPPTKFSAIAFDAMEHFNQGTTKESLVRRLCKVEEATEEAADIALRAGMILSEIDKIGGETWTGFGDNPSAMLEDIVNGDDIYWRIEHLYHGYKRGDGSVRFPVGIMEKIRFTGRDKNRKAFCTIDLNAPLWEQFNDILKMLTIITCHGNQDSENNLNALDNASYELEYKRIISNAKVSYDRVGDKSRAIGLWLWDKVHDLGHRHGAKIEAIKELEQLPFFENLGLGYDPDYYHFLRRTEACIEAAEVLAFDKKNRVIPKRKRHSGTRKHK